MTADTAVFSMEISMKELTSLEIISCSPVASWASVLAEDVSIAPPMLNIVVLFRPCGFCVESNWAFVRRVNEDQRLQSTRSRHELKND